MIKFSVAKADDCKSIDCGDVMIATIDQLTPPDPDIPLIVYTGELTTEETVAACLVNIRQLLYQISQKIDAM